MKPVRSDKVQAGAAPATVGGEPRSVDATGASSGKVDRGSDPQARRLPSTKAPVSVRRGARCTGAVAEIHRGAVHAQPGSATMSTRICGMLILPALLASTAILSPQAAALEDVAHAVFVPNRGSADIAVIAGEK